MLLGLYTVRIWGMIMEEPTEKEKAFERVLTGLGLVALAAIFIVTGSDLDPLVLWAVS